MVCAIGGLQKCPKFIRIGDTFGGCWVIIDFDDGFNSKLCSVVHIIIVVYINGVGYRGSSEMSQIHTQW